MPTPGKRRLGDLRLLLLLCCVSLSGSGCSWVMSSVTGGLAEDLTTAVLNQDDAALVEDGGPAYLILIDGLLEGSPEDQTLLLGAAQLYSAYAAGFVTEDDERARRMHDKARVYAERALCARSERLCETIEGPFEDFEAALSDTDEDDLEALYGFGSAWAGWVQAHSADWGAVAEIPKIDALMQRVIELDEDYEDGQAHVYLGVVHTLRPASLGGQPELGRRHFERAIEISEGRNLLAKVMFADGYGRLVFDKELHDRLLTEVLAADTEAPGFTLTNTVAKERARELLAESDDYF